MRVAICLYGYPSFYENGFKSYNNFLESIDFDFFIHSWCKENSSKKEINNLYKNINNLYKPKKFEIEKQIDFKNYFECDVDTRYLKKEFVQNGTAVHTTVSPLYSMYRVGKLLEPYSNNYDIVIVSRTDVFCNQQLKNLNPIDLNTIYSSYCEGDVWNMKLPDGSIDVKMIFSNFKNMSFLMNIYDSLKEYIEKEKRPLCHHRLFAYHLKKLNTEFKMAFESANTWWLIRNNGELSGNLSNSHINNYSNIFNNL
jgi:hypothetical protein